MPLQIRILRLQRLIGARRLFRKRLDMWRQQPEKTISSPFLITEGGSGN